MDSAREIFIPRSYQVKYSICALVTDQKEYGEMRASFLQGGFGGEDCEYLFIDNSKGNQADAFAGYNFFLGTARGRYIILCHQDILLKFDDRKVLEERLRQLDGLDPAWGLAGNAGGTGRHQFAFHLTQPVGEVNTGGLPTRAESLDENFIIVKNEANLCLSRDLTGFHLHGTDLCQIARVLGWNAWVIDFNVFHKSMGNFDESFYQASRQIEEKYQRALQGGPVQAMGMTLCLSGSAFKNWFWTPSRRRLIFEHQYEANKRRKKGLPEKAPPAFLDQPLGPSWTLFYWLAHKIRAPFQNLIRHAAKGRGK